MAKEKKHFSKLSDYTVYYQNAAEFHHLKREVYASNVYYMDLNKENPLILDAGAHIGLFTLYYKKIYPQAKIIALEPLPLNFNYLDTNVFENILTDVSVQQLALADKSEQRTFYYDKSGEEWFSTAGFNNGAWTGDQSSDQIKVNTQTLSYYLKQAHFDLVKLDIEGAEGEVLTEAADDLGQSDRYLVEYHPNENYSLAKICELFTEKGFKVTLFKNRKKVELNRAKGLILIEAVKKDLV